MVEVEEVRIPAMAGSPAVGATLPTFHELQQAAMRGDAYFMQQVAERHPGALTARTPEGESLAHIAAAAGHIKILSVLHRVHSEDILQGKDLRGCTPAHMAACNDQTDVVWYLVGRVPGILQVADKKGLKPLDYAETGICKEFIQGAMRAEKQYAAILPGECDPKSTPLRSTFTSMLKRVALKVKERARVLSPTRSKRLSPSVTSATPTFSSPAPAPPSASPRRSSASSPRRWTPLFSSSKPALQSLTSPHTVPTASPPCSPAVPAGSCIPRGVPVLGALERTLPPPLSSEDPIPTAPPLPLTPPSKASTARASPAHADTPRKPSSPIDAFKAFDCSTTTADDAEVDIAPMHQPSRLAELATLLVVLCLVAVSLGPFSWTWLPKHVRMGASDLLTGLGLGAYRLDVAAYASQLASLAASAAPRINAVLESSRKAVALPPLPPFAPLPVIKACLPSSFAHSLPTSLSPLPSPSSLSPFLPSVHFPLLLASLARISLPPASRGGFVLVRLVLLAAALQLYASIGDALLLAPAPKSATSLSYLDSWVPGLSYLASFVY